MKQPASKVLRSVLGWHGHLTVPSLTPGAGWPCYISTLPPIDANVPADAMCFSEGIGIRQGKIALRETDTTGDTVQGKVIERFSVQMLVRSQVYSEGWLKCDEMALQLDRVLRLGIDAGNYLYYIPNIVRNPIQAFGLDSRTHKRSFLFQIGVNFVASEEGPYDEWGNEEEELYEAIYRFHELIHVDMPTFFGDS